MTIHLCLSDSIVQYWCGDWDSGAFASVAVVVMIEAVRVAPAQIDGGFKGSLHHFRRDLSRWRCTMVRLSESERSELWDLREAGESQRAIARALDLIRSGFLGGSGVWNARQVR
jgi:hypothetical protein